MVRPSRLPVFQHRQSVERRQTKIEDDRVIRFGIAHEMPLLAVKSGIDRVSRPPSAP